MGVAKILHRIATDMQIIAYIVPAGLGSRSFSIIYIWNTNCIVTSIPQSKIVSRGFTRGEMVQMSKNHKTIFSASLAVLCLMLVLGASQVAQADAIYSYTGNSFTTFYNGSIHPS